MLLKYYTAGVHTLIVSRIKHIRHLEFLFLSTGLASPQKAARVSEEWRKTLEAANSALQSCLHHLTVVKPGEISLPL